MSASKWPRIKWNQANARLANAPFENLFREQEHKMSALDDALTQAEFGSHPDMDIAPAWAELAQLRADLQAAQERIAQLDKMIALNRYITPPFDLIDDATAQLAIECSEKDDRIAEQARQLEEARDTMIAVMPHLPISGDGYNTRHPARISIDAWLAANPAPSVDDQAAADRFNDWHKEREEDFSRRIGAAS